MKRRILVGISGASGPIYAVRLLQALAVYDEIETHLILTRSGILTLKLENPALDLEKVQALADVVYSVSDISACVASGSYPMDSMVVVPCSMKTLAAIAHGYSDNLLTRAADVMLKERRRLILVPRETPLHSGHLRNMLSVSELGAIVVPPVPAFYHQPTNLADIIDHTVGKLLSLLGLAQDLLPPWLGPHR